VLSAALSQRICSCLIFIVILLAAGCAKSLPSQKPSGSANSSTTVPTTIALTTPAGVLSKTSKGIVKKVRYKYEFTYPHLAKLSNPSVQRRVNEGIYGIVARKIREWRPTKVHDGGPQYSSIRGRYRVGLLNRNVFSSILSYDAYEAGAAHANVYITTVNYSLVTGKQILLKSFFLPGSDYIKIIAPEAAKQMVTTYGKDAINEELGLWLTPDEQALTINPPNPKWLSSFSLTNTAFVFHWGSCEAVVCAAGAVSASVSYESLRGLFDDQGPLRWIS
jgi:hypothetical protein